MSAEQKEMLGRLWLAQESLKAYSLRKLYGYTWNMFTPFCGVRARVAFRPGRGSGTSPGQPKGPAAVWDTPVGSPGPF
jgi:hypothetical protein